MAENGIRHRLFQQMALRLIAAATLLLSVPAAALTTISAAEICLKPGLLRCGNTLVTLADIADVRPAENSSEDRGDTEKLCRTVLFPAPPEDRTIDVWELRSLLTQLGVRTLHHTFSGAEKITVAGRQLAGTQAAGSRLDTKIQNENSRNENNPEGLFVVQARHLTPSGRVKTAKTETGNILTAGSLPVSSAAEPVSAVKDNFARTLENQIVQALNIYLNFTNKMERTWDISLKLSPEQLQFFASGGQIAEITGGSFPFTGVQQFQIRMQTSAAVTVEAAVTIPAEAVIVRRTLPKGHIITESDVVLQRIDHKNHRTDSGGDQNGRENLFADVRSVIGKETVKTVRELNLLTADAVRVPYWVRKGEIVTVRAASNGISVRTEATALQDGAENDVISVARIDGSPAVKGKKKKEEPVTYLARVCSPKTVEVFVK